MVCASIHPPASARKIVLEAPRALQLCFPAARRDPGAGCHEPRVPVFASSSGLQSRPPGIQSDPSIRYSLIATPLIVALPIGLEVAASVSPPNRSMEYTAIYPLPDTV